MTRPRLLGSEPQLFVTDFRRAQTFFTEKLGFGVVFVHGDPPFYGQVARDAARLNLRHVDALPLNAELREVETLLAATINLATQAEIELLFAEFERAGVSFHQGLRTEDWGARTFIVRDPDGNLLLFAAPGA